MRRVKQTAPIRESRMAPCCTIQKGFRPVSRRRRTPSGAKLGGATTIQSRMSVNRRIAWKESPVPSRATRISGAVWLGTCFFIQKHPASFNGKIASRIIFPQFPLLAPVLRRFSLRRNRADPEKTGRTARNKQHCAAKPMPMGKLIPVFQGMASGISQRGLLLPSLQWLRCLRSGGSAAEKKSLFDT